MSIDDKWSIIFMRDDARVRRFRVSPSFLRFLAYLLLTLLIVSVGGVYGTWHYWQAARGKFTDQRNLERELAEASLRLERLQNLETILNSNDPAEIESLVSYLTTLPGKSETASGIDLTAILSRVDLRQAGVENFRTALVDDRLRISFDLNNLAPASPLAGRIEILLVGNDGVLSKAGLTESEAVFQIQRLKRFTASIPLPKGFDRTRFYGLRLVINNPSGMVIFSETYPFAAVLS